MEKNGQVVIWQKVQEVDKAGGSVILADAATGKTKLDDFGESDRVSTHRLVRYAPTWDPAVEESKHHSLVKLVKGDVVAVVHEGEIVLARVDEIEEGRRVKAELMKTPKSERHGGYARRPWKETGDERELAWDTLLGRVVLGETGCMTPPSLQWVSKWAGVDLQ